MAARTRRDDWIFIVEIYRMVRVRYGKLLEQRTIRVSRDERCGGSKGGCVLQLAAKAAHCFRTAGRKLANFGHAFALVSYATEKSESRGALKLRFSRLFVKQFRRRRLEKGLLFKRRFTLLIRLVTQRK